MKMTLRVLLCVFAAVVASTAADSNIKMAPLYADDSPTAIDGEYVVILNEDLSDSDVGSHMVTIRQLFSYRGNHSTILSEYHIGNFRGYGARMDDSVRDIVRSMSHVKYVERSQVYKALADCTLQSGATWGIVRTTYRDWSGGENDYSYDPDSGEGVEVYIIDTGIYLEHTDFGGRAVWGYDAVDSPSRRTDGNGHGTHVAGTVMSNTWGLARKATSVAVRVLNDNGSGSTIGVMAGVDWVADQHSSGKKSIANMSLGGGKSTAMNAAVDAAVDKGVSFAIAAGNENQNACNVSPGSAEKCVGVGATDSTDKRASFSNYGTCVDVFGPGVGITSTWRGSSTATNTISGTSMAAPHVAGVMAKYLSEMPASTTPKQLEEAMQKDATPGKVENPGTGSPNLLIFKDCE